MKIGKRILAGLAIVVATVVFLSSVASGISVWFAWGPALGRVNYVFGRVDRAMDLADGGLKQVKESLARAGERLEKVKDDRKNLPREPSKSDKARKVMARTVQNQLAPELGNAQGKLHTIAEAAVVVNSVLEDVGNIPGLHTPGLSGDQLQTISGQLTAVSSSAWELSRLLGESPPDGESDGVDLHLSRVEQSLKTMQERVAEYEPRLAEIRERTASLQSKIVFWINFGTVAIGIGSYWIALSQVIVVLRASHWWNKASSPTAT